MLAAEHSSMTGATRMLTINASYKKLAIMMDPVINISAQCCTAHAIQDLTVSRDRGSCTTYHMGI